jgi:lysophospholipase
LEQPSTSPTEAAPLLSIPEAVFPAGSSAVWYRGSGGRRLRAAHCPAARPIGSVVLSPGRTEPIEKYCEVVAELVGRGLSVLVHDWRGQGLSDRLTGDRLKGHARGFDDFLVDYKILIDQFEAGLPQPRIAMGHSMGGCLTLMAAARGEARFDGMILSAPMFGLRTAGQPYGLVRAITWLATRLGRGEDYLFGVAKDPFVARFETDCLTHDRARYDRTHAQILADRDLALGNITWGWLQSAFEAMQWLADADEVAKVSTPTTVVAAGRDMLVDNARLAMVTARLPHGRYVEIAGAYHEILMETDALRAGFWREFDALVAAISPPA